jgi:hypothetical protein
MGAPDANELLAAGEANKQNLARLPLKSGSR